MHDGRCQRSSLPPVRAVLTPRRFALSAVALLPPAALGVHELRYRLEFGADTEAVLAEQGHSYLGALSPLLAFVFAIACARLLLGVARGRPEVTGRAGLLRMWLACSAALFAVYTGQELLEGALSTGHPGGLAALFAAGGWMSAPLCLLIGLGLAGVLRLARAVAHRRSAAQCVMRPHVPAAVRIAAASAVLSPAACLLARRLAGRAPPQIA
jgi:hypothetical protein